MSRKANLSEREVLRWFDPKANVSVSRHRKLYQEYLRSPLRMVELNWTEKGAMHRCDRRRRRRKEEPRVLWASIVAA